MTAYNLITPLHRFVIERSADLLVGSRPCGFHCVEMAPRVAASYHGIFRTELLAGITRTACRKFNKEQKIEVFGFNTCAFLDL